MMRSVILGDSTMDLLQPKSINVLNIKLQLPDTHCGSLLSVLAHPRYEGRGGI